MVASLPRDRVVLAAVAFSGLGFCFLHPKNHCLYFCETSRHLLRRMTPDHRIETVAGDGTAGFGPNQLHSPLACAVDERDGTIYVVNGTGNNIVTVDDGGKVAPFAGSPTGEAGPAPPPSYTEPPPVGNDVRFNRPQGCCIFGEYLYVCDTNNDLVRRIKLPRAGVVREAEKTCTIVCGVVAPATGSPTVDVDGATGPFDDDSRARICRPRSITVDKQGVFYISTESHVVRRLVLVGSGTTDARAAAEAAAADANAAAQAAAAAAVAAGDGDGAGAAAEPERIEPQEPWVIPRWKLTTIVGTSTPGAAGTTSPDPIGRIGRLKSPGQLVVSPNGKRLWIACCAGNCIMHVEIDDKEHYPLTLFVGNGSSENSLAGVGELARLKGPVGVALDVSRCRLYWCTQGDGRIGSATVRAHDSVETKPSTFVSLGDAMAAGEKELLEGNVTLVVRGGTEITVVAALLANRIPHFSRVLQEGFAEGKSRKINLSKGAGPAFPDSPEAVRALVRWVYHDRIPFDDLSIKTVTEILVLSLMWDIEDVAGRVELYLREHLAADTAADICAVAHQHSLLLGGLYETAVDFIIGNLPAVVAASRPSLENLPADVLSHLLCNMPTVHGSSDAM